jgi:hypothetical protein
LEDLLDLLMQLRLIAFDDYHIVAALHDTLCNGTLRQQGIDGDDPALYNQSLQHGLKDRELIRLVCHGLLPQSQPQAMTEDRE